MINISKIKNEPTKRIIKKGGCYNCNSTSIVGFQYDDRSFRRCTKCGKDWIVGGDPNMIALSKQDRDEQLRMFNFNAKDRLVQFGDSEMGAEEANLIEETLEKNRSIMFGERH